MKNNIKLSVLMPVFNSEKFLNESIKSILSQTFSDFEFIILDDWSSDKSEEIIKSFSDSRIIFLKNFENKWISFSRNLLLKKAKWRFIAFMDSDDISLKNRFQKQIEFLEKNKNYQICGTNLSFIDSNWKEIFQKKFPENFEKIKKSLIFRNPMAQNTIFMEKKIFFDIWFYDENLDVSEDLDFWIRAFEKYKAFNIQENLVKYRIHNTNSIFLKQKNHIKNTLFLRKKMKKLWYKFSFKAKIFYFLTFFSLFLPRKKAFWYFNKILKKIWN